MTQPWRRKSSYVCVATASLLPLCAASAQPSAVVRGCVSSATGNAVINATVSVRGVLLQTRTSDIGCFAIALPVGEWQLVVRKFGYRPVEVVARSVREGQDALAVVMETATTELGRLVVNGEVLAPFTTTVTPTALRQVPALGERDPFRALPFLPGVAQPNDILGRLHLAGGASDEHGITLNGHPLQAPFHINSVMGAFNPASLDRVEVVMHHLPVARFDRVSGTIDLHTRDAAGSAAREAQLTVLSASGTVLQPHVVGNTDVLATGRASYLDAVLKRLSLDEGSDDLRVPSFRDALVAARTQWSPRWESEVLLFHTQDWWFASGSRDAEPPTWGENLLGVRVGYGQGPWSGGARVSVNRATVAQRTIVNDVETGQVLQGGGRSAGSASIDDRTTSLIDMNQRWISAQLNAQYQRPRWGVASAIGVDARNHDNSWLGVDATERLLNELPPAGRYVATQLVGNVSLEGTTVTERRAVRSTVGVRASSVGGAVYLAPRASISAPVTSNITLSVGLDRRFQFDAIAAEPIEGSLTQPVFFPVLPRSSDVAAFSAAWRPHEASENARSQISAAIFGKRNRDRPVLPFASVADNTPPPAPPIGPPSPWSPPFTFVDGFAVGATLGFDIAFTSGWLLQGSYTWQRSQDARDGVMRPTPWDAPHQLTGLLSVPLGRQWQFTVASQFRSGPAVTPIALTVLVPFNQSYFPRYIPGEPLTARAPAFFRADIGVQRTWVVRRATWVVSAQAINALASENGVRYSGVSAASCSGRPRGCANNGGTGGLPFLPSVGIEVRW